MIERSPLDTETAIYRIRALRQARQIALRTVELPEEQIERELTRLDDEIVGTSAEELRRLRASIH
jgi:hypothetical protein